MSGGNHKKLLELYEEISLARATFTQNLELCQAVMASDLATQDSKLAAQQAMMAGLQQIGELCDRMARIEQRMGDKVSLRQVNLFVDQIVRVVHDELRGYGDIGEALAIKIADAVKAKVMVPSAEAPPADIEEA